MINVLTHVFFFLLGISSLCVVLFQNTFFALLFLILSFLLTAVVLFFLECEFLALILIIVYVGAVAVLLLFVLMMLETKLKSSAKNVLIYFPFGVFINGMLFFELVRLVAKSFKTTPYFSDFFFNYFIGWYEKLDSFMDLEIYGQILYTQFVLQVLIVGLILFLALVGVIFLTLKPNFGNFRNQISFFQLSRSYYDQNPGQVLI